MKPHISALSILTISALFAPAAEADILKVPSATFPTIASAVAAAHSGDTIQIGPNNAVGSGGTYFENIVVPNTLTGLHFKGANVAWDGGANDNNLTFTGPNDGVTVEGFAFTNGLSHVVITGNDATITRCQSIRSRNAAALQITGNFAKVTNVHVEGGVGDGIRISGTDATIDQCVIDGRTGPGVDLLAADRASVSKCKSSGCDVGILAAEMI